MTILSAVLCSFLSFAITDSEIGDESRQELHEQLEGSTLVPYLDRDGKFEKLIEVPKMKLNENRTLLSPERITVSPEELE